MENVREAVFARPSTSADLLIDFLARLDMPYIFGVPGGNIDPLCHRLAERQHEAIPHWVLTRSEAGAAYMADGYFRETGRIGVCCTTSGPGATNLLTALSNAYVDNVPILAITAQTPIRTFGRGAMQETSGTGIDSMQMFAGCTRYNSLVSHPDQLIHKLHIALAHALSLTPGPVHLSIPSDILVTPLEANLGGQVYNNQCMAVSPDRTQLSRLIPMLRGTSQAVFALGPGAADAMPDILNLAEKFQWPIVTFPMARGLVSGQHPLYKGVFGTAGHQSAREVLLAPETALVMVVGADLDESATCGWDGSTLMNTRMVHISNNPEQLARTYMARLNLLGNPQQVFAAISRELLVINAPSLPIMSPMYDWAVKPDNISIMHWEDCITDRQPISPRQLFWYLSTAVPGDTRVFADTGNSFFWSTHYWSQDIAPDNRRNLVQISMGYASMGWAISAAIGCKFANQHAPVLCITGDGSVLMSGLEFTVACQHKLNVVFVILNNGCLGTIKHGQRLRGLSDTANELPSVNFALLARALGIEAYRISDIKELRKFDWQETLNRNGPLILDVVIDREVPPPIGQRINGLE